MDRVIVNVVICGACVLICCWSVSVVMSCGIVCTRPVKYLSYVFITVNVVCVVMLLRTR